MLGNLGAEYVKWVFLVLLAAQGGGNDLLDYADTQAFWREEGVEVTVEAMSAQLQPQQAVDVTALIKGLGDADWQVRDAAHKKILQAGPAAIPALEQAAKSDDPEIRTRAEALIKALKGRAMGHAVRRLMAVRTLGELGDAKALPVLKPLLEDKEPFVAEYARRSIAQIEGKPFARPRPPEGRRMDSLRFLPKSSLMIYQIEAPNDAAVFFPDAFKSGGKLLEGADLESLTAQITGLVTKQAMALGNVRIDVVTMGASQGDDHDIPGIITVIDGWYDRERMCAWLEDNGFERGMLSGQLAMRKGEDFVIVCPSNERMILLGILGTDDGALREAMELGLKGDPKAGPAGDEKTVALLAQIDTKSPCWLMVRPPADEIGPEGPESVIADCSDKDGVLSVRVVAQAKNPEAAKGIVDTVNKQLQEMLQQVEESRDEWKGLVAGETLLDAAKSVKAEAVDKTATFTTDVKGGRRMLLAMPMSHLAMFVSLSAVFEEQEMVEPDWDEEMPPPMLDELDPVEPMPVPEDDD